MTNAHASAPADAPATPVVDDRVTVDPAHFDRLYQGRVGTVVTVLRTVHAPKAPVVDVLLDGMTSTVRFYADELAVAGAR